MTLVGFDHLNLEDSFLVGIIADGKDLVLKVEFALEREHPFYSDPLPGEARCWRSGEILVQDIDVLSQKGGGPFLGSDPGGGSLDLGSIFISDQGGTYFVDMDMIQLTCRASQILAKF